MRLIFSILAALASGCVALIVAPVLLTSAWLDLIGDRGHPDADRIWRVHAEADPVYFSDDNFPMFSGMKRTLSVLALGEHVEAATTIAWARTLKPVDPGLILPELKVLRVEENFPAFFRVRWSGERLDAFEPQPMIWLTQTGAARLRKTLGRLPDQLLTGQRALVIAGVINDPSAGSHLRYEALVSGRLTPDEASAKGLLYVKTSDPVAAATRLGPLVSLESFETPFGFLARLTPLPTLRLAPQPSLEDVSLVTTGHGLEFAVAVVAGVAALSGGVLSLALLIGSIVERRRHGLGVRVMLGRSPARMALSMLLAFTLMLLLVGPAAFWVSWLFGGSVLEALGKPDMSALFETLWRVCAVVAVIVLGGAALTLSGLFFTPPARLALEGAGKSRRAAWTLAAGLAALAASASALMFSSSQFAAEVHSGAYLSEDRDRIWIGRLRSSSELTRARAGLEASPLVQDVAVLGWRPFLDIPRFNVSIKPFGGARRRVQISALSAETAWSQFMGARQLAGPEGVMDTLEGRSDCVAILERTAAETILPENPLGVAGRMLGDQPACRIEAVVEDTRRGKRVLHGDPVIHFINGPPSYNLTDGSNGPPVRFLLVRFREGVSQGRIRSVLSEYGWRTDTPPRSLTQLGLAAYERERRIAEIIGLCAMALAGVFLSVILALAMDTLEVQRKALAVRRALGARPVALARRAVRPAIWAALGGGGGAAALSIILEPFWRNWSGLAAWRWDMTIQSGLAALAISFTPMIAVFVIGVILIGTMSPARLIRD